MFHRVGILLSIFVCSSIGESARKAKYFPFPQTRNPSIHSSYPIQSHHGGYHTHEQPIRCPFPYVKVGDLCLYLNCDTVDDFTYSEARAYCQNEVGNGDLAVFEDACQFADALKYVTNEGPVNTMANVNLACDYFIGGSYDSTDMVWKWIDDTFMPLGVPYWAEDSNAATAALFPDANMGEAFLDYSNFYLIANEAGASKNPLCQYKPDASYGSGSYGSHSNYASLRSPYPAFNFPPFGSGYFPNPYPAHAQPSYSRSRSALNTDTKSFRGSQRKKNIGEKLKERSPVQQEYNFGQQQAEELDSRHHQQQEIEPEYRHDEPQTPLVKSQDSLDQNVPPTLESFNPFLKTNDKKNGTQDESPDVAEGSSPRNSGLQQDPKEEDQQQRETILYEKLFPSIIQEMVQTLDDINKRS